MPVRATSFFRRLFQFRLRTLLLAVFALCLSLGLYVRRVEMQRRAVAAVRSAGGDVFYDDHMTAGIPNLNADSPAPQMLMDWLGIDFFHTAVGVDFGPTISNLERQKVDSAMAQLPDLSRLQYLLVVHASDNNLKDVGKLEQLERLAIFDEFERVTDEGIEELRPLRRLKYLWVEGVGGLTDESLRVISTLQDLEVVVVVSGNRDSSSLDFTADGLFQLEQLKKLRWLNLQGCEKLELSRLRKALPNCAINK